MELPALYDIYYLLIGELMMFSQFAQIAELLPKLEEFGDHIVKFTDDMAAKQQAILENQALIIEKLNALEHKSENENE